MNKSNNSSDHNVATHKTIQAYEIIPAIDAQALLDALLNSYPEYRLSESINNYGYIIEVVIGSLANVLALAVNLGLTHLPTCNYMAALAMVDLSVLLGPCLIRFLLTLELDPRTYNTAVCRLLNFQTYWSFSMSAWLLVAMTIDRYVAISFPLKAMRLSTPRRARAVTVLLMLVMSLVNSHFLFTMHVEGQPGVEQDVCIGYDNYESFLDDVWPWIDATIYSFLPFFFLFIFNFLIVKNYRKSAKIKSTLKGSKYDDYSNSSIKVNRKLTLTLLTVAITFMVLTAPRALLTIIRPTVFNFKPTPTTTDYAILARYTLTASLVNLLMISNHCINFFLYVLTGRKFREQLVKTFTCCGKRKLRRIHTEPLESGITELRSPVTRNPLSATETMPAPADVSAISAGLRITPMVTSETVLQTIQKQQHEDQLSIISGKSRDQFESSNNNRINDVESDL